MRTFQTAPPCPTNHFGASQSFDAMICAYKTCGGTARADDLALLLEERQKGDFVSVAKGIVSRDIFSFDWGNHFWARGYFVSTIGLDEDVIRGYVKYQENEERKEENQGRDFGLFEST